VPRQLNFFVQQRLNKITKNHRCITAASPLHHDCIMTASPQHHDCITTALSFRSEMK
jgi:hypothetical protein